MIELPWPPKELSPNARIHHMEKAKATKAYRETAYWLTAAHGEFRGAANLLPEGEVKLRIEFYPPDRRRRDLDGMFSSIKAGLDGIADAICVNDQRFGFDISRRPPVKNGRVVITIGEGE